MCICFGRPRKRWGCRAHLAARNAFSSSTHSHHISGDQIRSCTRCSGRKVQCSLQTLALLCSVWSVIDMCVSKVRGVSLWLCVLCASVLVRIHEGVPLVGECLCESLMHWRTGMLASASTAAWELRVWRVCLLASFFSLLLVVLLAPPFFQLANDLSCCSGVPPVDFDCFESLPDELLFQVKSS